MSAAALTAVFLVGLLGGGHCLGMCGGIVTALTVRLPRDRPRWSLHLAYHAGRITTYAAAGALAGGLGSAALLLGAALPIQVVLYVVAQLVLVALGLYLVGVPRYLDVFERAGKVLWQRIQPAASALFPVRTPARGYAVGLLWGLLPCGLVYSVLVTALVSGSAKFGALTMLAFGAGTLPSLLAAGTVFPALARTRGGGAARRIAGGIVIAFGLVGLAYAGDLERLARNPYFCWTAPGS
ncbi:MAG TPA: sulfite exporter TauE/SafE family protein [Burkholderiales bacterium]|nr:sulfite exporter TauE/SafE family protein [Burkholderiales bacterium]